MKMVISFIVLGLFSTTAHAGVTLFSKLATETNFAGNGSFAYYTAHDIPNDSYNMGVKSSATNSNEYIGDGLDRSKLIFSKNINMNTFTADFAIGCQDPGTRACQTGGVFANNGTQGYWANLRIQGGSAADLPTVLELAGQFERCLYALKMKVSNSVSTNSTGGINCGIYNFLNP